MNPMNMETRVPWIMRAARSRPCSSVPMICFAPGPITMESRSYSEGLYDMGGEYLESLIFLLPQIFSPELGCSP
jgi:hypothetical protein